ncbi:hypothetical protein H8S95_01840 [Pontibacter sp. KCTC 32443]|uniref:hypothetical protein n=1 Tax=Pontibacter TaxID=323449 RepID=UPI00164E2612|nr:MULTISPECIES: hypothetical protein [Pontibacter]MBC5772791.1 hypothetical protein [Pontibacter sp. KCTC 32443]
MIEEFYYQQDGSAKITAATIGVSKNNWTSIVQDTADNNTSNHLQIMQQNKFNVLPIVAADGHTYEYFETATPHDYSQTNRHRIKYKDTLPLDTSIKELIWSFALNDRVFYFLTLHGKVSGLVTVSDLNNRYVQIYIFSLICELERTLSGFIKCNLQEQQIFNYLEEKANRNDYLKDNLERYKELNSADLAIDITEFLFLKDFFEIISKFDLYKELGYGSNEWKKIYSINELRNSIAHPTRSLINKEQPVITLQSRLERVDDLLFRLKHQQ